MYDLLTGRFSVPIHNWADGLLEGFRDGVVTVKCRATVEEMRTYVEIDGRYGAEAGCKDDRVTSVQIANQMMTKLPRRVESSDDIPSPWSAGEVPETSWMAV